MKLLLFLIATPALIAGTGNVISYDTLVQLTNTHNPTGVSTELTAKDQPGCTFVASTPAEAVDGALVFPSINVDYTWRRQFTGPLDIRWFGATGDGMTDDAPAFNTALAAAEGGAVYVPNGQYRVFSTLSATNVQIIGESRWLTQVFPDNGWADTNRAMIEINDSGADTSWGPMISKMRLGGNVVGNITGLLKVDASTRFVAEDIEFRHGKNYCLFITNRAAYGEIARCTFSGGDAVDELVAIKMDTDYSAYRINECYINIGVATGVGLDMGPQGNHNLSLTGCILENLLVGVRSPTRTASSVYNFVMRDNWVEGVIDAWDFQDAANKVDSVTIETCSFGPAGQTPAHTLENARNVRFIGNYIGTSLELTSSLEGVHIQGNRSSSGPHFVNNVSLLNIKFQDQTAAGAGAERPWLAVGVPHNTSSGRAGIGTDRFFGTDYYVTNRTILNSTTAPATLGTQAQFYAKTNNVDAVHLYGMDSLGNEFPLTGYAASGNGIINVKDFGAVGDGVTDDTAAWDAAIAAAGNTNMVILPGGGGGYLVDGTVIQGNSVTNVWHNLDTGSQITASTVQFRTYEFDLPTIPPNSELSFTVLDPEAKAGQWFKAFHWEWPYLAITGKCTTDGLVDIKLFNSNGIIVDPMVETFIVMFGQIP